MRHTFAFATAVFPIIILLSHEVDGFVSTTSTPRPSLARHAPQPSLFGLTTHTAVSSTNSNICLRQAKKPHPEFTVVSEDDHNNEDDDDNDDESVGESVGQSLASNVVKPTRDATVSTSTRTTTEDSSSSSTCTTTSRSKPKPKAKHYQYTALSPGTVVQIQVGDVRLARKAWKKRRRSGSPLLVPCSVLTVDRASALRWNLLYLLQKFGHSPNSNNKKTQQIRLSLSELAQRHKTHLKSNLNHHATALGFDSVQDLIVSLLDERVQESYGVQLLVNKTTTETNNNNEENSSFKSSWYLQAPISRFRAQQRANQAAILQFSASDSDSSKNDDDDDAAVHILKHTGTVRNKRSDKDKSSSSSSDDNKNNSNMYQLQPLSAALRVSRDDLDSGLVQNDGLFPAVIFDYDLQGDAGAPLLVLSLNPGRNQVRNRLKISSSSSTMTNNAGRNVDSTRISTRNGNNSSPSDDDIPQGKYSVKDLQVGSGPLQGKVVRLVKGGALVDCGVSRKSGDNESVPVLGFLRFKDAVKLPSAMSDDEDDYDDDDDDDDEDDNDDDNAGDDADWEDILSFDGLDDNMDKSRDEKSKSTTSKAEPRDLSAFIDEFENEDDENESVIDSEDITHLFEMNEDGYAYTDPDTGLTQVIFNDEFDDEADDNDEDEDDDSDATEEEEEEEDGPVLLDKFASKPAPTSRRRRRSTASTSTKPRMTGTGGLERKMLKAGDLIDVYVLSAAKQSHQLKVTMNPNDVCGKSARDLKHKSAVNKKLNRLAQQLSIAHPGSGSSLRRSMQYWKGREMNGIVKATSQTGDWLYVQPRQDDDDDDKDGGLPVGVASFDVNTDRAESVEELRQGDPVRIRVQGIDKDRGQLSLRILRKLQP